MIAVLFWVFLVLAAVAWAPWPSNPTAPYAWIFIVIDVAILGLRVFGLH